MRLNPQLKELLKPRLNKYIKQAPTPKQQAFLLLNDLEVFYGGAAGGAKSSGLLMASLQYVDIPGYNAILLRDTLSNLKKPGALIPRSHEWLIGTDAKWNGEDKYWTFPSGATLSFGYLDGPVDHFNYLSSEYQFVGIDELVGIRKNQAEYLFSRLRRLKNTAVPIRYRVCSNPPTREQMAKGSWVKKKYIDPRTREDGVIFLPAKMDDNPYLDTVEYRNSLKKLDPITRKQLEDGDWDIKVKGRMINRDWFEIVEHPPSKKDIVKTVRFWDLAATEPSKKNKDPDYTVGIKMSITKDDIFYIENRVKFRKTPGETETRIISTATIDGKKVSIKMEQEPGSSGVTVIASYVKKLKGYVFKGIPSTGSKINRFTPFSSMAEAGNVKIVNGVWVEDYLDELEVFPDGKHDDDGDGTSGAFDYLTSSPEAGTFGDYKDKDVKTITSGLLNKQF